MRGKEVKMTLRGYYSSLPEAMHPKTEFVNKVAKLTGASTASVRNWILGMKPQNHEHIKILSEVTGISEDCLWME